MRVTKPSEIEREREQPLEVFLVIHKDYFLLLDIISKGERRTSKSKQEDWMHTFLSTTPGLGVENNLDKV